MVLMQFKAFIQFSRSTVCSFQRFLLRTKCCLRIVRFSVQFPFFGISRGTKNGCDIDPYMIVCEHNEFDEISVRSIFFVRSEIIFDFLEIKVHWSNSEFEQFTFNCSGFRISVNTFFVSENQNLKTMTIEFAQPIGEAVVPLQMNGDYRTFWVGELVFASSSKYHLWPGRVRIAFFIFEIVYQVFLGDISDRSDITRAPTKIHCTLVWSRRIVSLISFQYLRHLNLI